MKLAFRIRSAFTLIEGILVIAITMVLIALLLPAVVAVRARAAKFQCSSNLRQIGIGLANYHSAHGRFPPGVRMSSTDPFPDLTWLARILPHVEQDALWKVTVEAYGSTKNITMAPPHPLSTVVSLYVCPADARVATPALTRKKLTVAFTSYLGVSGTTSASKDGTIFLDSTVRVTDITDGTSNTLLVGERPPSADFWYGWWYAGIGTGNGGADMILGVRDTAPMNDPFVPDCGGTPEHFGPGRINNMCDTFHFWSLHPGGGANFLFADGSVRFLAYSADPLMTALATRAGGEASEVP
jgi:prepilin-type processing-associated H-X9-DG protein